MSASDEEIEQTADADHLPKGTPVGSDLVIEKRLGTGGFATVYLARNKRVEHIRAAVKVLLSEYMTDENAKKRFLLEAEMGATLSSRHVVQVQSFGELDDGTPYLVMEYIVGPDLEHLLYKKGALTTLQTARIARDILVAVEEAHQHGIVHRDLKPANVFLVYEYGNEEPIAKVGDFGIGKQLGRGGSEQESDHRLTIAGQILCTPAYAAPELLRGTANELTDLYALGHVIAELLEGEPPYVAWAKSTDELHPMALASNQIRSKPVPLSKQTEKSVLGPIIRRALAKNPTKRYQSASDMLKHVREAIEILENDPETDRSELDIDFFFDEDGNPQRKTGDFPSHAHTSSKRRVLHTTGTRSARSSNATRLPSLDHELRVRDKPNKKILAAVLIVALLAGGALIAILMSSGNSDEEVAEQSEESRQQHVVSEQAALEAIQERQLSEESMEAARTALFRANRIGTAMRRSASSVVGSVQTGRTISEASSRTASATETASTKAEERAAILQRQAQAAQQRANAASNEAAGGAGTTGAESAQGEDGATNSQGSEPQEPEEPAQENPFGTGLR